MNKSNENFLIVQNAMNISQQEAFSILEGEDETLKPLAFFSIDKIENKNQAELFLFQLTNHSNPTREACAIRFLDVDFDIKFFEDENSLNTFVNAICDINPNVARAIIELISRHKTFAKLIMPKIIEKIEALIEKFKEYEKSFGALSDNKMKNRKNHAKNKKLFNLYWCLEALGEIVEEKNEYDERIVKIIYLGADFLDYTIREKSAKILAKISCAPKELLQKLKNDENFYVKNQVYDKIC